MNVKYVAKGTPAKKRNEMKKTRMILLRDWFAVAVLGSKTRVPTPPYLSMTCSTSY